jgi:hypothetical protein
MDSSQEEISLLKKIPAGGWLLILASIIINIILVFESKHGDFYLMLIARAYLVSVIAVFLTGWGNKSRLHRIGFVLLHGLLLTMLVAFVMFVCFFIMIILSFTGPG